jgi:hypothetical protein
MTLAEDIVHLLRLRPEGMTDAELAQATGKLHQQINQRCRALVIKGELTRRTLGGVIRNQLMSTPAPAAVIPAVHSAVTAEREWFWEGNVQAMLCTWLVSSDWHLDRVMNTATKERGTDIEATGPAGRLHVEVKGYPSKSYADPRRAGEVKPTKPALQAKHWFADALLKTVRLRDAHPDEHIAMAFPDFPRYRSLLDDTRRGLTALRIGVFLVTSDGSVTIQDRPESVT